MAVMKAALTKVRGCTSVMSGMNVSGMNTIHGAQGNTRKRPFFTAQKKGKLCHVDKKKRKASLARCIVYSSRQNDNLFVWGVM